MLKLCSAVVVAAGLFSWGAVAADPAPLSVLLGTVRVIDGDTLALGSARIRLRNVDAPELDAAGGPEARDYLVGLVQGRVVECLAITRDRYGRILGTCRVAGADLGEQLVAVGLAVEHRRRRR